MDIQKETYRLLAQKLLTNFDNRKFVNWAVMLLENGYESENIMILAGLDKSPSQEIEKYFEMSLKDIKFIVEKSENELVEIYAEYIINEVLKGAMIPSLGLSKMLDIVIATDYNSKYILFFQLDEDIDYLGLDNIDKKESYIQKEFELFVESEKLQIDDETKRKAICNDCGIISLPKLKTKYIFRRPFKYQTWICGQCRSEKIEHFSSLTGKSRIIEIIKNHTQQRV
jgi:hypothetical protein